MPVLHRYSNSFLTTLSFSGDLLFLCNERHLSILWGEIALTLTREEISKLYEKMGEMG